VVLCGGSPREEAGSQKESKLKRSTSNGFLSQQTKASIWRNHYRSNKSYRKDVIVIGGGDTGSIVSELQIVMVRNHNFK
jgi:NADPH-dependent glutamate synthase beta subunit-like oxidoreductase